MTKTAITLMIIVIVISVSTAASVFAADTDRLATCVAVSDQNEAEANSRGPEASPEKRVEIVDRDPTDKDQTRAKSNGQVPTIAGDGYNDNGLTRSQLSARTYRHCLESE
jgi:hypothetical protein